MVRNPAFQCMPMRILLTGLEGTAHYAGLLLAPAEGFSQVFFLPLGKKRAFHDVCAY